MICVFIFFVFEQGRKILRKIRLDSNTIKKLLKKYKNTLIDSKTTSYAEEFFDEEEIFHFLGINTKILRAMAGTLVGIGVCGTFLGLTIGLYGVNLDTTALEMQKSINSLLGGMTTAFWTSLFGMFFSIVYTYLEKKALYNFSTTISRICNNLNEKYYISPEERIKHLYESNFKIVDDQGKELHYGDVIRRIKEDMERLSSAADNINEEFLINIMNKAVSESLKPELSNVLHSIFPKPNEITIVDQSTENLIKVLKETTTSLDSFKDIMPDIIASSNEILEKINDIKGDFTITAEKLSETAKASMSAADMLGTAQIDFTETINRTQKYSEEYVKKFEGIDNSLQEIFTVIEKNIRDYSDTVSKSMTDLLKEYANHTDKAITNLGNAAGGLQDVMRDLNDYAKHTDTAIKSLGNAVSELKGIMEGIADNTQIQKIQSDKK